MELKVIAFVEAQLEEPLREDGPIFGMNFESLPSNAIGMHYVINFRKYYVLLLTLLGFSNLIDATMGSYKVLYYEDYLK